ncbi:DDE-type integrase/transposase/recombinase [Nostocaceae cyanobacterium CENA369]|uniref:DDE-type integrase/transposase/recombinase n=1 Tax=Dendronalium phyllosphericum CENA369 TaxID=1725256 RepID=A0A8J7I912_9NOST|nr:Mu transposase C-terminal domain-containing protein [Dendronalium phyllosphericum]MBH8578326.1 DDE-type integrase/transposase/recombinase [Dendronalium phyllosphericum CENA369]
MLKIAQDSPNRWQREDNGKWRCPPAEEYASQYNLYYTVCSSAEINSVFVRNFVWLEDYFQKEQLQVEESVTSAILTTVKDQPGINLSQIIQQVEEASIDDLNILIATNQVYVDLGNSFLGQPEQVEVFLSEEEAFTHAQITKISAPIEARKIQGLNITVGTAINWDGITWKIVNTGDKSIALLRDDENLIELPNSTFEHLFKEGKITGLSEHEESSMNSLVEEVLKKASQQDITKANNRYKNIESFLNGTTSTKPNRTQRRWIASYRKAEKVYGRGFIGLFPKHKDKGWHRQGIPEEMRKLMEEHISDDYENQKQPSIRHAYYSFRESCKQQGYKPPSQETYRQAVRNRPLHQQIQKRISDRAAYKEEPFYWYLYQEETPVHGDRPFEIGHIDHTEADTELICSIMLSLGINCSSIKDNANLGKAWVTLLVDTYTRRTLAIYMTFDPPSYHSDMMVLRICVQKYGRLPQIIVIDGGPDFRGTYFETLLAYFKITKKERPKAKPRHGSVIESFFGVADKEFWHNLKGNTQIMKNVRQVTKGVNPKNHAVWTLSKLYTYFCEYCYEIYDTCPHPALKMTPREAFNLGMARSGLREHMLISEKEFNFLGLPSPKEREGKRQVTQEGVKINYLYYWHPSFTRIRNACIEVKYDPFDITVAYAYFDGEWNKCHSRYLRELQGHSERELMIAATELKKLNQLQNKTFNDITGKKLAEFFTRIEMEEAALTPAWRNAKKSIQTQRQKDAELKQVHAQLEGKFIEHEQHDLLSIEATVALSTATVAEQLITTLIPKFEDDIEEIYEPLEEW